MSSTSRSRSRARRSATRADRDSAPERGVSGLDAHLGYWLRTVSNHVSHAFKIKVETHGVTVAEWVVLRALYDADELQPSELATRLGLSRGAISKLVDRLVAKELLVVRSDEHDGRAQRVSLKPAGRRLVPKLAALADENDAEAFGHLPERQREALLEILMGIAGRLEIRGTPME